MTIVVEESLLPSQRRWQDLRAWRLSLGLSFGPIILSGHFLALALVKTEATDNDYNWVLGVLIVGLPWVLIGGWSYLLAVARHRRRIGRRECLLLGLGLIILIPPVLLIFAFIIGGLNETGNFLEELERRPSHAITALLSAEAVCALAGLLSGWLFWRFGVRPARQPAEAPPPIQRHRRWEDLHGGRLTSGLGLGSLVVPLLLSLFWILDDSMASDELAFAIIGIHVMGLAWGLVAGWIYLLAVPRRRRRITRMECLMLGVVLIDLIPLITLLLVGVIGGQAGLADLFSSLTAGEIAIVIGAALTFSTLSGLLNGWLFWRFGVRPAPTPVPDVTGVFD
jgi:hypothetical protein